MAASPGSRVLIGTSSPAAAAQLAGLVDARLILRLADPSLAAILAGPAGGEPGSAARRRWRSPATVASRAPAASPGAAASPATAASPVSAGALLSLGPGEFVLTVSGPARRLVALGRLVPARLPRPAAGRERGWRRLRLDPA